VCTRVIVCNVPQPRVSKGEAKSKVTKSAKFGGGKWQVRRFFPPSRTTIHCDYPQVLFYANAGPPYPPTDANSGGYVSLFLSCEVGCSYFSASNEALKWEISLLKRKRMPHIMEGEDGTSVALLCRR
jgi:hypothetical protein